MRDQPGAHINVNPISGQELQKAIENGVLQSGANFRLYKLTESVLRHRPFLTGEEGMFLLVDSTQVAIQHREGSFLWPPCGNVGNHFNYMQVPI